ncbi:hypothetical protein Avbf_07841 [Armadillidium vulgare]|nr:hypothetical protein Avbf_07841 [Armadillidium vulgare]
MERLMGSAKSEGIVPEPEQGDLWSTEKARGSSRDVHHMSTRNHIISPPPTLLPMGSPFSPGVTVK